MKINAVEINMEAFGACFANMDDNDQAAFFKGFVAEIKNWPARHLAEMQFCCTAAKLTRDERQSLENVLFMLFPIKDGTK